MARPRKDNAAKRGKVLTTRVDEALHDSLRKASTEGARTISQEIQMRLRTSFNTDAAIEAQFGSPFVYVTARMVAEDLNTIAAIAGGDWFQNRFAFDEAKAYLQMLLGAFRAPPGIRQVPDSLKPFYERAPAGSSLGRYLAKTQLLMLDLARRDPERAARLAVPPPRYVDTVRAAGEFKGKLAPIPAEWILKAEEGQRELARRQKQSSKRRAKR